MTEAEATTLMQRLTKISKEAGMSAGELHFAAMADILWLIDQQSFPPELAKWKHDLKDFLSQALQSATVVAYLTGNEELKS